MTTQHLHHEHSDADVPTPVVEDLSAPETVTPPPQAETAPVEGQEETRDKSIASQHEEATASSADATGDISRPGESAPDTETQNQVEEPATTVPTSSETGEGDVAAETVSGDEQEVRPFTAFIEEFQQEQARLGVAQPEQEAETFAAFSSETVPAPLLAPEFVAPWQQTVASAPETRAAETAATPAAQETGEVPEFLAALNKIIAERPTSAETAATAEPGETPQGNTEEAAPAAQAPATPPVSPLLRPPSRIRVPRHHTRQREESTHAAQTTPASTTKQVQEESSPATAAPAEAATSVGTDAQAPATPEAGQTRPARRYRFDRPARTEERRESTNRAGTPAQTPTPATQENGNGQTPAEHTNPQELQGQKHSAPAQPVEPATTKTAAVTEAATETAASSQAGNGEHEPHERRRRHGQERQREKEQPQAAPAVTAPAASTPAAEPVVQPAPAAQTPEPAPVAAQPEEVNPEDLPPLEYAELQAANSRRRRRRRSPTVANAAPAAPASNAPLAAKPATPDTFTPGTPAVPSAPAPAPVPAPHVTPIPAQYNIVSGYTVSQMNQNGDGIGPFMGPDPSPARGSTPGHALRSGRAEVQRAPAYPPMRTEPSGASVHHLATVVAQAIQTQTDRMVAELRRANQGPTNVAVTLPPFPSTERVGVFVDVANLLYSARTMRINIDFGKLLDFLRGNRRLVRAQAYCPTSPQAGDEQMFLQAVKGLGYRITTKNYKTFSSGAKKADLDLDLCMDVVRLVDGRAVDCIVLVSGDSDFMPMLDYCSDHGVRVEVAAFDEAMSATLRQSCDLFINLSMLPEIRA